jgi:hypothetical protein
MSGPRVRISFVQSTFAGTSKVRPGIGNIAAENLSHKVARPFLRWFDSRGWNKARHPLVPSTGACGRPFAGIARPRVIWRAQ